MFPSLFNFEYSNFAIIFLYVCCVIQPSQGSVITFLAKFEVICGYTQTIVLAHFISCMLDDQLVACSEHDEVLITKRF